MASDYLFVLPESRSYREKYEEILISKHKLAAKKVSCPIEKLENGILMHDMPLLTAVTSKNLPRGGEKLMSNPFPKVAKKGKKGKKKKKK